jgi:hypothetical protein
MLNIVNNWRNANQKYNEILATSDCAAKASVLRWLSK